MFLQKAAIVILGCTAVILGAAGCNTQPGRTSSGLAPGPSIDQSHPGATLILGSEELLEEIEINSPRLRSLGQLTQGQATVQNLTDERYTLEYRFGWQDGQHFSVGDAGSWHRFTLAPRQADTFSSTGKVPEATHFVLTVRLPDDVFIHADKLERERQ